MLGAVGRQTKDHSVRFGNIEQKNKGKIESYFSFHFDPSFIHQTFREPNNLSYCIWPFGEVQGWIQYRLQSQEKGEGRSKEFLQLPVSLPKDMNSYTLPGFVHSHLSRSPRSADLFTWVLDSTPFCLSTCSPFLSLLDVQPQNASLSPNSRTNQQDL